MNPPQKKFLCAYEIRGKRTPDSSKPPPPSSVPQAMRLDTGDHASVTAPDSKVCRMPGGLIEGLAHGVLAAGRPLPAKGSEGEVAARREKPV